MDGQIREILEAHVREYFINAFLLALNWRISAAPEDGIPNLAVEVRVKSRSNGRMRFIDYLGSDGPTSVPLLLLEAKRPGYELPYVVGPGPPSATYRDIIARGLARERLSGEWNEWLESLRDYANSAERQWGRYPRRVVITNGDWLVAFLDPKNAFAKGEDADALRILVIQKGEELEKRSSEIFMELEYHQVVGKSPPLHLGELAFHVQAATAVGAMHGVRLLYVEEPRLDLPPRPVIRVAPILFVELASGGFLRVDSDGGDFAMPDGIADFERHLLDVSESATRLLESARSRLTAELPLHDLTPDGMGPKRFSDPIGVMRQKRGDEQNEYVITTGRRTHFCHRSPSILNCPYHNWERCNREGVAAPLEPRLQQSVSPRSFFRSGDVNHCSHVDLARSKSSAITSQIAPRCGWRESFLGEPFCAIWEFETELCCRTCSFEGACTASPAFVLPCDSVSSELK
jgi:hypothetical protein